MQDSYLEGHCGNSIYQDSLASTVLCLVSFILQQTRTWVFLGGNLEGASGHVQTGDQF